MICHIFYRTLLRKERVYVFRKDKEGLQGAPHLVVYDVKATQDKIRRIKDWYLVGSNYTIDISGVYQFCI